MKKESEQKILELIKTYSGHEYFGILAIRLQEILTCEANEHKFGKLNLYSYCAQDKVRPIMNGVYHDNGWRVVSDCHILLAIKQDYPAEHEGKSIAKDGSAIEGKYPDWKSVIPQDTSKWQRFYLDFAELATIFREAKAHKKIHGGGKHKGNAILKVGDTYVNLWRFELFVNAMREKGLDGLQYLDAKHCIMCKDVEIYLLLMPMLFDENEHLLDPADDVFYRELKGRKVVALPKKEVKQVDDEWNFYF